MKKNIYKPIILTLTLITLCLVYNPSFAGNNPKFRTVKEHKKIQQKKSIIKPQLILTRIKNNFSLDHYKDNKLVKFYINKYKNDTYHMEQIFYHAEPYLYHITEELEKRKLPSELIIVPMIESNFNPHAKSNVGAAGVWQLGKTTAKMFSLENNEYYDGRHDVFAATDAALDYLELLYEKFNHDWYLTLAAYNYGEGKIRSLIKQAARKNIDIDYWSLNLPKETRHFVPKLLAIANLIANPELHNLKIQFVKNEQYFSSVQTNEHLNLKNIAELSQTKLETIKRLNPGYIKHIVPAGKNHTILLPFKKLSIFNANLENIKQFKKLTLQKTTFGDI